MRLRDYQVRAVDSTFEKWANYRTLLGVLPTGGGKTVVLGHVIRRITGKSMVIAHRQELVHQLCSEIRNISGKKVDIEMAELKAVQQPGLFSMQADVIVASVQTLTAGGDGGGRLGKFDPAEFGYLFIDEAHHAIASGYQRVIDYMMTNPGLRVLGVTATPNRSDKEAMSMVFRGVAFNYAIIDAIDDGWLVPIDQQFVIIENLDFSAIKTVAGDLNQADLDAEMMKEAPLYGIADATVKIAKDKRGIGFAVSVAHAYRLAEICNRHKPGMCACVCAATDKDERRQILADFAAGKIQFVWNCGILTEGFNDAGVEVIIMARPTKSTALYAQMIGRSTRPHLSLQHTLNSFPIPAMRRGLILRSPKPCCTIADCAGNSGRHKLVTVADILGGNVSTEAIERAITKAKSANGPVRIGKLLIEEERNLQEQAEKNEELKVRRAQQEARRARLKATATFSMTAVNPFDSTDIKPVVSILSNGKAVLTEGERKMLRKFGYNPDKMDPTAGKKLMREIFGRLRDKKSSPGQIKVLKRCGWTEVEAKAMSYQEASDTLDHVSKNGWRKPTHWKPQKGENPY